MNCDLCGGTFADQRSLSIHRTTFHKIKNRYECDECKRQFKQQGDLTRHLRVHSGERPFTCDECELAFTQSYNLKIHKRIHTGEKPFECDECDAAFTTNPLLTRHKCTHTGERHHTCTECDATFARLTNLHRHVMTIHKKEHPFPCEQCDVKCASASGLRQHMLVHTGEKPHQCPDCPMAYNRPAHLKTHHYYNHTEEGQKYRRREEIKLQKLLDEHAFDYKREHWVDHSCTGGTNSRIDFFMPFYLGKGHVILECDEEQHAHIDPVCEVARMNSIVTSLMLGSGADTPVVFIRYNPHGHSVNGNPVRTSTPARHEQLVMTLRALEFTSPVQVIYMFYDDPQEFEIPWPTRSVHAGLRTQINSESLVEWTTSST